MGWFDDLETRVKQAGGSNTTVTDIYNFFADTNVNDTIAIAKEAGGNLTALQIAEGIRGAADALAPAHATEAQTQNSLSASQFVPTTRAGISAATFLILAAGAFFLMNKRGRRG